VLAAGTSLSLPLLILLFIAGSPIPAMLASFSIQQSLRGSLFFCIAYILIAILPSVLLLVACASWANRYTYNARLTRKLNAAQGLLFDTGNMLDILKDCSETGDTQKVVDMAGLNQDQFDTVYDAYARD